MLMQQFRLLSLLRVADVLKKAGVKLTEAQIASIKQIKEPVVKVPNDLNSVGPCA